VIEKKFFLNILWQLSILMAVLIFYCPVSSAVPPSISLLEGNHIVVPIGQVANFEIPDGIAVVVTGDKEIAEIIVPPGQNKMALINTKAAGITNVLIWTNKGGPPINFIIEVMSHRRNEQIIARVKVLELTKGNDGDFGVDWFDSVSFEEAQPSAPFKFGMPTRTTVLTAKINTLLTDKKAKVLAQPTLVALTGQDSSFLSGGEVPVAFSDANKVHVEWKQYGIGLKMNAKIEGNEFIELTLTPEVSSIDKGNSVSLQGSQGGSAIIPAFTKRTATTTVILKDNESIVIAGLLRDDESQVVNKLPLLGDIPVLGYLFSTTNFTKVKTELVFIVTPSIVKPKTVMPEANYGTDKPSPSPSPSATP